MKSYLNKYLADKAPTLHRKEEIRAKILQQIPQSSPEEKIAIIFKRAFRPLNKYAGYAAD